MLKYLKIQIVGNSKKLGVKASFGKDFDFSNLFSTMTKLKEHNKSIPKQHEKKCKPFFSKKTIVKKKQTKKKSTEVTSLAEKIEKLAITEFGSYTKTKGKVAQQVYDYKKRDDFSDKKRDYLQSVSLKKICKDWKSSSKESRTKWRKNYAKYDGLPSKYKVPTKKEFFKSIKGKSDLDKEILFGVELARYRKLKKVLQGQEDAKVFNRQLQNMKAQGTRMAYDENFPALYDPEKREIHGHKMTPMMLVHEIIHHYSSKKFRETLGKNMDEGVTQFFSDKFYRKYGKSFGVKKKSNSTGTFIPITGYDNSRGYRFVKEFESKQKKGLEILKKAYFGGNKSSIKLIQTEFKKYQEKATQKAKDGVKKAHEEATKKTTPQKGKTKAKP